MSCPDDIPAWRRAQRDRLLALRMAIPPEQHRQWCDTVTGRLLRGFPMLRGAVLGFCWPFKGEFDPRHAVHGFRQAGATAALPVVLQKNAALEFRTWWPGVTTEAGVFGLPVPQSAPVQPQALLVPPVGIDDRGYRLGYGGGYFDRTLAALTPRPLTIAVGFELSRMLTIHPQPHDIPMDFVVTEAGIFEVTSDGLQAVHDDAQLPARVAARRVRPL